MTLPVPSESTATVGLVLTASMWNTNVRDGVNYLLNPPVFIGVQTAAQSLVTATFTAITFDTETVDTYGGHSTVTNTSRYVAQVAGWYEVVARAGFAGNATGRRMAAVHVNGSQIRVNETDAVGSVAQSVEITETVFLNVGDYVETDGYQSSGGALNTQTAANFTSTMTVRWVHA